jgi:hypothetical protein
MQRPELDDAIARVRDGIAVESGTARRLVETDPPDRGSETA